MILANPATAGGSGAAWQRFWNALVDRGVAEKPGPRMAGNVVRYLDALGRRASMQDRRYAETVEALRSFFVFGVGRRGRRRPTGGH